MSLSSGIVLLAALCMAISVATPVRRSPDLEARRRSAIDRNLIRFGRSYPPEPSAAELRELFQRPTRRGNSFLRFGKSEPLTISADDLLQLIKTYDGEYDIPVSKKSASFIRFGRDPSFIRFGRSGDEEKVEVEQNSDGNAYPQRKHRARNHFIRLGRDSEELNEEMGSEEENENRRSTEVCHDCA